MRRSLILIVVVTATRVVTAQTSVVQDSEGKTSIVIPSATTVNFNFADSKLEAATKLARLNDDGSAPLSVSLIGSVKSTSGTSKIFDGKGFSPAGSAGFSLIKFKPDSEKSNSDGLTWFYGMLSHSFGTNKLYDSLGSFDALVKKDRFGSTSITFGVNRTDQKCTSFGVAVQGVFASTNYDDLDDYVVAAQTVRYNADSSQSSIITGKEENVKGLYSKYENGFNELNIIGDFLFWPEFLNGHVVIGTHLKGNFRQIDKPKVSGTIGIYLTKAGDKESDPTAIVGGLVFETQDFFKKRTDDGFKARSVINLVVGYNFKY